MSEFFENKQELYKVSAATKKLQMWKGWTENEQVFCSWGEFGGKLQEKVYSAEGKNIGKVNETSGSEQALIELQAMYASQIKNKHYKCSSDEAFDAAKCCRVPRKITDYKKRYDKMSNVLLSSVKKNGSRGCVVEGVLYSKAGLPEDIKIDRLCGALEKLNNLGEFTTFDAEIFAEGLSLQRIRSAWLKPIKTDKEVIKVAKDYAKKLKEEFNSKKLQDAIEYLGYNPNEDAPKLKFYIFDIPDNKGVVFKDRVAIMREFEDHIKQHNLNMYFEFLYPVETKSHEERMELRDKVCFEGSEGLVHYEPEGVYEYGKRSTNTCKSKPRYDTEVVVLSVTEDKSGEGVLSCRGTKKFGYAECDCKMKVHRRDGSSVPRDYNSMLNLVGKWITMSYEELSDTGKFTKPVGELERRCDSKGNPVE